MTYSVWDWNQRRFALYRDNRQRPLMSDVAPCPLAVRPGVGGMVDVGMTLCALPHDAQPMGWSDVAVGQVARPAGIGGAPLRGRAPGLGGLGGGVLFAPGAGGMGATAGVAPGGAGLSGDGSGLGFSFTEAVVVNVLVSVIAGVVSTWVFKNAFAAAGKAV